MRSSTSSVVARDEDVVAYLHEVLGLNLTAVIAQTEDAAAVSMWGRGQQSLPATSARSLRAAYEVTKLLEPYEAPETVQAWFVGMNPILGDRAPAVVVAEDPEAVARAARAFVAYG
jgi:hypothetical protein